jgi:hypothetical protein
MGSLQWALSWLVVGAIGLAPILVYGVAGLIGRAFRRKLGRPRAGNAPLHTEGEERSRRREAAPPGLPPT